METLNLKKEFLKESNLYEKGMLNGNYKEVNKAHQRVHKIYEEIRKNNIYNFFETFLDNENDYVKLNAATFSLKTSPEIAEKILEELIHTSSILATTAKMTLDLWHEGKLTLL
ncbi:hypothetical protein [Chryseobacterium sp.]|uniref:hypothetical protein n=1 Tax=Chryseobacterium sp. TaxID=1871047 RepID=UPI0025BA8CDA|nr:hypothetical protein [Chryseobacterium sp.]MBV8327827.1 hypothetical protein [Chryseobacterium sp.]